MSNKTRDQDYVRVPDLILIRETEKAWGCATDPKNLRDISVWIPKSLLPEESGDGSEEPHSLVYLKPGYAWVPRWWADKNDLSYED